MPIPFNCSVRHQPQGLELLYEDRDIIVVDKAPGLLTIATDKKQIQTAYYRLMEYVRKGDPRSRNRIFIVHRLDRDVSGILVFAKSSEAKEHLQEHWAETEKKYLTVVHGRLKIPEGTISTYLAENKSHIMYSTSNPEKGKLSHTNYRVLKETEEFSLLEINLLTGRKNQIRAHLAEIGHPIVGDEKYDRKDREHKRLALHAYFLLLTHPYNGKTLTFQTEVPGYVKTLLGGMVLLSDKIP